MLRISPGMASIGAQRALGITQRETERAMRDLAQGTRFSNSGSDPAGFAISESLAAQNQGYKAARMNSENATSFLEVAEGALNEQTNVLIRLRELAIQAASDTFSDVERGFLDNEFQQLLSEFDRIARSTKFGSQPLLDGTSKDYEFQVGVHKGPNDVIKFSNDTNTTSDSLGLGGMTVSDKSDARDTLDGIDSALMNVNGARAKLGAIHGRLQAAKGHIDTMVENLTSAYSRMAETDVAETVAKVRRGQVLQAYQAQVLQDANNQQATMLKIIG